MLQAMVALLGFLLGMDAARTGLLHSWGFWLLIVPACLVFGSILIGIVRRL